MVNSNQFPSPSHRIRVLKSILTGFIACMFLVSCAIPGLTSKPEIKKMSIIMPGQMYDHDYNELATTTGTYLEAEYGLEIDYLDEISVPSLPEVLKNAVGEGSDVIWLHGGQYEAIAYKLSELYPEVTYIIEEDDPPESTPKNVWIIDRNFPKGMYIIGRLAVEQTETNKIGYICGLNIQSSYGEVHAIQQAIQESGKPVVLTSEWVGDFNDPELARKVTDTMIASGIDVIISSLNSGTNGVITAIKDSPEQIWFTSKYTDKYYLAPENYLTSFMLNYNIPLDSIIQAIRSGTRTGYYQMDFNKGLLIQYPIKNVQPALNESIEDLIQQVRSGEIEVERNFLPLE